MIDFELSTTTTKPTSGPRGRSYTTRISGLRMATTYSFEVRPVQRDPRDLTDPHSIGKSIIVPTKGCKSIIFYFILFKKIL